MRYEKGDKDYPGGYWINMRDVSDKETNEELILFIGLEEQAAQSIFNRLNLFLEHWLKEDFGIF